jgi:hypothetical protein
MSSLSDYCIHTFRHSETLRQQAAKGGHHMLTERKPWVTGRELWARAEGSGKQMAVLFSAAEDGEGIIYWAVIDDIVIDDRTRATECCYSDLRPVTPSKRLSTLRLREGDKPVSDNLIRPYAICHTPTFLR